jgi:RNA polymerase sigma factor (sigma-70 family)
MSTPGPRLKTKHRVNRPNRSYATLAVPQRWLTGEEERVLTRRALAEKALEHAARERGDAAAAAAHRGNAAEALNAAFANAALFFRRLVGVYCKNFPSQIEDCFHECTAVILEKFYPLYDPNKARFSTWAAFWVRNTSQAFVHSLYSVISTPVSHRTSIKQRANLDPKILDASTRAGRVLSIDMPATPKGKTYAELVAERPPEVSSDARNLALDVLELMESGRPKRVLELRMTKSLQEIADASGMSKERVRQIETQGRRDFVVLARAKFPERLRELDLWEVCRAIFDPDKTMLGKEPLKDGHGGCRRGESTLRLIA